MRYFAEMLALPMITAVQPVYASMEVVSCRLAAARMPIAGLVKSVIWVHVYHLPVLDV
jgi:hypothetical protein